MADRTPEQQAHEQAMVAKVDNLHNALASDPELNPQAQPQEPQKAARPDNIPEQFWDPEKGQVNHEALLKAYQEATAGKQEQPTDAPKPDEQQQQAEEALKAAKLDMATIQSEYDRDGTLSEATYQALEKAGFGKDVVDSFIAGQEARAQLILNEVHGMVGGQEGYSRMAQWAAQNLSAEDQAAYDTAVAGTQAQRKQAITALKAQYEAAVGKDPSLVSGQSGGTSDVSPFGSRAEVTAAMRDARYQNDPAYRAMVHRRIDAMDTF